MLKKIIEWATKSIVNLIIAIVGVIVIIAMIVILIVMIDGRFGNPQDSIKQTFNYFSK